MPKSGINKVILVGNLARDPESRQTANGSSVCNLTVVTSESWVDKNSQEKKEKTEWHRVVVFGKLAEICSKYLEKGKKVYMEGSLQTRKWTDDQGIDRYSTEVVCHDMQMLGGRPAQQSDQYVETRTQDNAYSYGPKDDQFNDDIPF